MVEIESIVARTYMFAEFPRINWSMNSTTWNRLRIFCAILHSVIAVIAVLGSLTNKEGEIVKFALSCGPYRLVRVPFYAKEYLTAQLTAVTVIVKIIFDFNWMVIRTISSHPTLTQVLLSLTSLAAILS